MPNSVCYGCVAPKRHVGCRTTCPRWAEEVLATELRKEVREIAQAGKPANANMWEQRNRWIKAAKNGGIRAK